MKLAAPPPPAPRTVMAEIDAALGQLPADAQDVYIELSWPHYKELLAIKCLDTDAGQIRTWGSGYVRRPLKLYRGYVLKYYQYGHSLVVYSKPDGSIGGIRIAYQRDTE
ncbi:hypothetical protein [Asticcacaulis sp.]|uniref:hypothetical protein n=1 Tax=Asticcacaulis sp. TaxID=1872648 RepID=UPI003F7C9F5A